MIPVPATLGALAGAIEPRAALPLLFVVGDAAIRPGYHVTELKAVSVESIDCGGRTARFRETHVQLLDGAADEAGAHMTGAKFLAIVRRSLASVPALAGAPLFFEYGPGNGPALRLAVEDVATEGEAVIVRLAPERAACKPMLAAGRAAATACGCAPASPAGRAAPAAAPVCCP